MNTRALLLVLTVAAIGMLHTAVPDHWAPIALLARQRGWSKRETAVAALQAGTGHVVTTLVIGLVVWGAGIEFATRFSHLVDKVASLALVLFGGWIAVGAWRELHLNDHGHSHGGVFGDHHHHDGHGHHHEDDEAGPDPLYVPLRGDIAIVRHVHAHRHRGTVHVHWHDHSANTAHEIDPETEAAPPLHVHRHKTSARMALLLILGSSPMVEGIPVFFAASLYGAVQLAVMAVVFAASTIITYVVLCVYSAAGLQWVSVGPLERYGEVISGAFIALVGVVFWLWPVT